jgi:hypothetical protein
MRTARIVLVGLLAFSGLRNVQADFSIQNIQANPDGSITITWPVTPTFTYHVKYADAPDGSWQEFPDGQLTAATNDFTLCYTDTNTPATSQRFYKVKRDPAQVIMTLVLDTSGSMGVPGGSPLRTPVQNFITNFNDNLDKVALVKFSTIQTNLVSTGTFPATAQPAQPFRAAISNAVSALTYSGATFTQGGLTNALVLENNAITPPGQGIIKVVVLFTDGMANIVQDTLNCPTNTLLNFGGLDAPSPGYNLYDPVTGNIVTGCSATTFHSAFAPGGTLPLNRNNITEEALNRSIVTAYDLRASNVIVYCIGFGYVDTMFLQILANDPAVPGYVPTPYDGAALVASNTNQLTAVFQTIASQILSRAGR